MSGRSPPVPLDAESAPVHAAMQQPWRKAWQLSSIGDVFERFLARAGFDRGPWLAVALAGGIALWFVLPGAAQWVMAITASALLALAATALWRRRDERAHLRMAMVAIGIVIAFGILLIWTRSALVGAEPIVRPMLYEGPARILSREDQPARNRIRLILAIRDVDTGTARKVRVNLADMLDQKGLERGAMIRLRTRLMPPASPMVPGAYDFARTAWFQGLAATGSVIGPVEIVTPSANPGLMAGVQRKLSAHVAGRLDGSAGSIAAAFASGDRGSISSADEEAMRDAGLTHLLSISGLHVSAVIAGAYFLAIRLLALLPWLALRVRLPIVAAGIAACMGIFYTLLTGAEVPTVRACVAAMLVLVALAMGREPLSLRMVALAALFVLLLWPESLVGPSFQMSFSAVLAIIALHQSAAVRAFLAPRAESWTARMSRRAIMLFVTGLVIEMALMPIVLFHFHRAGFYGAFANVIAIPLVTFVSMPLIAFALVLDVAGLGGPVWWLAGQSLDVLLGIAHWTANQPGAIKLMPRMTGGNFTLFVMGGLWLALWKGRVRLLGLMPSLAGAGMLLATPVPDVLISGDGRHVGIAGEGNRLLVLRESRSDYTRDNLLELAAMDGETVPLDQWPDARCSPDFCALDLVRDGAVWRLLAARSHNRIEERALAAACERADIVIADRWLPKSCHPRWLKADRKMLDQTGGMALVLTGETIQMDTVASYQGEHGWWRPRKNMRRAIRK
ncbi:MAG: ComEC/Rec2 family competence protein [Sphingomonadaceae bacterium]